ncbi:TPA: DnaD domain protein [Streptococcus agalactiae]|nr:DnaD domain protein [Streptococcus agalactiae]
MVQGNLSVPGSPQKGKVQYDKDFPKLYDMGNMTRNEERMVTAVLSELHRLEYSKEGITLSYGRLAKLAGGQFVNRKVIGDKEYVYPRQGKLLNDAIEQLNKNLVTVRYKKIISTDEFGIPNEFDDIFLFTDRFKVNHKTQEYTLFLSDSIYQDEIIDENGKVIPAKKVYDLFYQEDWSRIQYLKYSLFIHNALSSQYSMRLYRELAGYRSYGAYYAYAERFEKGIMKINTPSLIQNKSIIIKKAFKELKALKDQFGNPIIPDLAMKIERRGRSTYKYTFTFKHFSNDLLPVSGVTEKGWFILDFPTKQHASNFSLPENTDEDHYNEVLEVFLEIFGTDTQVDNANNRKTLSNYLEIMDKEVIIEIIKRTGYEKGRSFGWTVNTLRNLNNGNVRTMEDLALYEKNTYDRTGAKISQLLELDIRFDKLFSSLKDMLKDEISILIIDDILYYIETLGMDILLVESAIRETIFQNKDTWKYTKTILDNWSKNDIKELEDLNKSQQEVVLSKEFKEAMTLWE